MKKIYQITITFTEPMFALVPSSNVFFRAESPELAGKQAEIIFKESLVKSGIPDSTYKVEIKESSEAEVEAYKKGMKKTEIAKNINLN